MQSAKRLRAVLLGAGSLGRAFLRRLRDDGGPVDLVGVVTAHHGRRFDPAGLDPGVTLAAAEAGELGDGGPEHVRDVLRASAEGASTERTRALVEAIMEATRPDVLVECIPQNIRSGEPAITIHRTALDAGIHVVTANKSPIALGYRDLRHRAAKSGATFRFEATVLDGLPIFAFVGQLRGQRVMRARGVLNATSSVVLETVGTGGSRARGLARAQAQGIAEADPILDLDGWDAAAKAALLANVWFEGSLRVVDVVRGGLEGLKDAEIHRAAQEGHHHRLVAVVERDEAGLRASVSPVVLLPDDPFFALHGPQGGLEIETDLGHRFAFIQRTAGLSDAAGGLLADCRAIASGAPQI